MRRVGVEREAEFRGIQRFDAYESLVEKIAPLGVEAVSRCRKKDGQTNIEIDMLYGIALIRVEPES